MGDFLKMKGTLKDHWVRRQVGNRAGEWPPFPGFSYLLWVCQYLLQKKFPRQRLGWEQFTCDTVSPCTNERVMTADQGGRKSIPSCALEQPSSAASWGSTPVMETLRGTVRREPTSYLCYWRVWCDSSGNLRSHSSGTASQVIKTPSPHCWVALACRGAGTGRSGKTRSRGEEALGAFLF